ncbi:MAG: GNAT family N-acetyltransferase [Prevotella sp.]|nr:GNAT family N-acetyltransferase [Prevotella sp.]
MIKFSEITEDDKDLIQSYTLTSEWQNCDLSFPNLVSWKFLYDTQFSIVEDYLVIRFWIDGELTYMMPMPKPHRLEDGTEERDFSQFYKVIQLLREDSALMGQRFSMLTVKDYLEDILEKNFPDTFLFCLNRDRQDYIYLREKLVSLAGKKLQSKRNHVNKFKSLFPQYKYKELTPQIIPQCHELARLWKLQALEGSPEEEENLLWELRSMKRAFNRWEKLGFLGGAIFVDEKLIAFSYGCPINQNTFDVCVEKADISYPGAFNIINQEFCKHIPEEYTFINREEDLGDEGLRRAKLSYRPEKLLEKCNIIEKNPLIFLGGQERIRQETKKIWREVFKDPEWFIDLYFSRIYKPEYNIYSQAGGKVIASLQILPYSMLYHGKQVNTSYVSGVSTLAQYRGQGIGGNLLKNAHLSAFYRGDVFSTLIPAEEWLQEWYLRKGYSKVITCGASPLNPTKTTFEEFDCFQRSKKCIILHDESQYDIVKEDILLAGDSYGEPTKSIQAMLRVINATRALEVYAETHPKKTMAIRVSDDKDIPMNNSFYLIKDGKVRQTNSPGEEFLHLTIGELAQLIFQEEDAFMCLMLN